MIDMKWLGLGIVAAGMLGFGAAAWADTDPGLANAAPQTDAQKTMLAAVQRWRDGYNVDEKFVTESYAEDADATFNGASVKGHAQFLKLEHAIKKAAPGRYMRIDHVYFIGDDRTVVEAVELDHARPKFYSPWCAILQFKDGKVIHDRTYLEANRWPGIAAAKGIPTPGGLGAP